MWAVFIIIIILPNYTPLLLHKLEWNKYIRKYKLYQQLNEKEIFKTYNSTQLRLFIY